MTEIVFTPVANESGLLFSIVVWRGKQSYGVVVVVVAAAASFPSS